MDKNLSKKERSLLNKVAGVGLVEFMNEKPFEHRGSHGTILTADRCDFRGDVIVDKPKDITYKHFAQDMMEIAAWHAIHIHPKLNGFQGYDAFEITLVAH
jgi:hypothetical protein